MTKDKTNKERLICIENKVDTVITGFSNHLEHHRTIYDRLFKLFLAVLVVVLAATLSVITALVL